LESDPLVQGDLTLCVGDQLKIILMPAQAEPSAIGIKTHLVADEGIGSDSRLTHTNNEAGIARANLRESHLDTD
jgi:hypothetical protein